jgi:hypothetical protein
MLLLSFDNKNCVNETNHLLMLHVSLAGNLNHKENEPPYTGFYETNNHCHIISITSARFLYIF